MPPTIFCSTNLLNLSYGAIKCITIAFHVKWVHEHLYKFKYYISNFHIKINKVQFWITTLVKSHFAATCVTYVMTKNMIHIIYFNWFLHDWMFNNKKSMFTWKNRCMLATLSPRKTEQNILQIMNMILGKYTNMLHKLSMY